MRTLRSILFNILFYLALIGILVLMLPTVLVGPAAIKEGCRVWARVSLWLLRVICGTRVEFRGRENIPKGACLVASKHQSIMEVFALTLFFDDFNFVLKRELTWIPLFGWYLSRSRQIAINRATGRAALASIVRQARRIVAVGGQVFIFPEGTRRPAGAPPAYKFGVAFIYDDLKVPCVPVGLNSGLFWPRRAQIRRPGTVVFEFLPPIQPGLTAQAFASRLEQDIETSSNRLIAEAVAADPSMATVVARNARAAATPA